MPKPISDWKKPECYPDSKNASPHRWAYEFLRRNHDYQQDFLEFKRVYDSFVPGKLTLLQKSGGISTAGIHILDIADLNGPCVYEPPRNEGEKAGEWLRRVGNGTQVSLDEWYATKWGLKWGPFDPFEDYEHSFTRSVEPSSEWYAEMFGLNVPRFKTFDEYLRNFINFENSPRAWTAGPVWDGFNKPDKDAFIIDYRCSINAQIALIKRTAKERQDLLYENGVIPPRKETRNSGGVLFQQYLRCLDAIDSGIGLGDIAKGILPKVSNKDPDFHGNDRIRKQIAVAEALRQSGYRFLLASGK